MFGGAVTVAAPRDYCIAPGPSRLAAGFAVLGRCDDAGPSTAEGLITVQMGDVGSGFSADESEALRELLQSDVGRGLLSSSGAADLVSVDATEVEGDAVVVRFRDRGPTLIPGLGQTEWRTFFDVDGRLVTVAVRGLANVPLGTDDGEVLLARTISAIRQANGVTGNSTNS